jgi:hypothetical protein
MLYLIPVYKALPSAAKEQNAPNATDIRQTQHTHAYYAIALGVGIRRQAHTAAGIPNNTFPTKQITGVSVHGSLNDLLNSFNNLL